MVVMKSSEMKLITSTIVVKTSMSFRDLNIFSNIDFIIFYPVVELKMWYGMIENENENRSRYQFKE